MKVSEKLFTNCVQNTGTVDSLAELLGVSHRAVSRWELGMAVPTVDNLVELCDLFEVSFEQLLCLDKKRNLTQRTFSKDTAECLC